MIIYKVTNLITDKSYIGKTIRTLNKRKKEHISKRKKGHYFQNSLKKYGEDNFKWELVERCKNIYDLNIAEEWYIRYFNTICPNGYNLTTGGESEYKYSEKVKQKMSENRKGIIFSEETKLKMSESAKIRIITKETRLKMSESLKGRIFTKGWKKKISESKIGFKHSEETKKKISKSKKGTKHTKEAKLKISKSNKGRIVSEETRLKIGFANKGKKSYCYGKFGENNICSRKYKIIFPNGKEKIIKGITHFCREYEKETGIKLYSSNLIKVAKGEIDYYKKFKCEYI